MMGEIWKKINLILKYFLLILSLNVFSLCGESEKDGPNETKGGKVDH